MTQVKYSLTGLITFSEYYEFESLFKKGMESKGRLRNRLRPLKRWLNKHPNIHFEVKEVQ